MLSANSISITIDSIAYTLYKIDPARYQSEYLFSDSTQELRFFVRHSKTKAGLDRHNVELQRTVFAVEGTSPEVFDRVYVVHEHLRSNDDVELSIALLNTLTATAGAMITELFGWQS